MFGTDPVLDHMTTISWSLSLRVASCELKIDIFGHAG
jgi:hypothetical protein